MKHIKSILCAFALIAMVTACASNAPEIKRYSGPRYTDSKPIPLKVRQINVDSEFTPTFTAPNVEHLFPVSIEKAARLWAKDRLEAVGFGTEKQAFFIIKDASVTEDVEKSNKLFYKDRILYRANLNVVLKVIDDNNNGSAQAEIQAWRELAIPADSSIEEKERYWNGMVDKLFDEFNLKMEENIRKFLNMYVAESSYVHTYN